MAEDNELAVLENRRIAWKIAEKWERGAVIPLDCWDSLVAICQHYLETTGMPLAEGRPAPKRATAKKKSATK